MLERPLFIICFFQLSKLLAHCSLSGMRGGGRTLKVSPNNLAVIQAALYGLLKKVRDLGMPLVSAIQIQFNENHPYRPTEGEKK